MAPQRAVARLYLPKHLAQHSRSQLAELAQLAARSAMPKRKRTSAEAKQGAEFRDLPESIVKEHLLPFLCHESWYDGHQFIFEQIIGVGHRMVEHGSWKHAGFEWARDISQLACTNRAMWKALGSVSLQALRRNRDCHALFLSHALRELYRLQGLPSYGDLFKVDDVALSLLPKEEARRSILMRYKVASFQRKLLAPLSRLDLGREFRSSSRLDLVEEPVQPEAHRFHYDDGGVDVIYW